MKTSLCNAKNRCKNGRKTCGKIGTRKKSQKPAILLCILAGWEGGFAPKRAVMLAQFLPTLRC